MDTAVCNHCGEEKPIAKFNWRYKKKGIRQPTCRHCQKKQKNRWYQRNRKTHVSNMQENKQRNKAAAQAYIWDYLSTHPCVDCGESDPVVLEFDHVRGIKRSSIARMVSDGYRLEHIINEIRKCEVRCSNCHRRKHYKEGGGFRS